MVQGPEYCRLMVRSTQRAHCGDMRKIAATRSGTTMVGEIVRIDAEALDTCGVEAELASGMAVEIEWREGACGPVVFEVNLRFPSWVGALGPYGEMLVRSSITELGGRRSLLRAP